MDRRKARTRKALVDAARAFLAEGCREVSIQEITDAADVGFGSFYNHFTSKEELFATALVDVLEEHGRLVDQATSEIDDPAEVFAASVRLTVRMADTHVGLARILAGTGVSYLDSEQGLAPRALRDIQHAMDAGRFRVSNPYVALASAGGALLALLHLRLAHPDQVPADAGDELAEQLLRTFGMSSRSAHAVAHRPLPEFSPLTV
ncbi:TetR/AcrR family transcriptional regulator [Lentzea sp. E54]|uniref:TetR/AcrR family transcriptional regulator n=1 Tax=Lentzea xerophila TaxID=3435883 RepID=UPI003DA3B4A1